MSKENRVSDERLADLLERDSYRMYQNVLPMELSSMLAELQSLRAQGGVRVKPLEWAKFDGLDPSIYRERAVTSFGTEYHISKDGWWEPLCPLNKCEGIEVAKAAAEADYRQRILSALLPKATAPVIETRNDEAGFIEFLNEDVPTVTHEIDGRAAILLDLNTRQVVGYRVYAPATAPVVSEPLTLDDDDLETILAIGMNEQSGRVTNYELKELVRVYRGAMKEA